MPSMHASMTQMKSNKTYLTIEYLFYHRIKLPCQLTNMHFHLILCDNRQSHNTYCEKWAFLNRIERKYVANSMNNFCHSRKALKNMFVNRKLSKRSSMGRGDSLSFCISSGFTEAMFMIFCREHNFPLSCNQALLPTSSRRINLQHYKLSHGPTYQI